jgi:hypothetical protein
MPKKTIVLQLELVVLAPNAILGVLVLFGVKLLDDADIALRLLVEVSDRHRNECVKS